MAEASQNPAPRERRLEIAGWVALGLLLIVLFAVTGNTHEPTRYGRSVLGWLIYQWNDPGTDSAHGWLIPCVSVYLLWRRRGEWFRTDSSPSHLAFWALLCSAFLYWAGVRAQQPRLAFLSLIGFLWSIPSFARGRAVGRLLFFPCVYLLFAIPMPAINLWTFPLRLFSTTLSAGILNGLGISTIQHGTALLSNPPGIFALDVDDPCSGMRSLIALTAMAAVYAYLLEPTHLRRWALFILAVPIAILANTGRIISIAIIARLSDQQTAMRFYHDFSGYLLFVIAVLLLMAAGNGLDKAATGWRTLCERTSSNVKPSA